MSIDNLQVVNLADNINAAIDKMNENFDLTKNEMKNIVSYIDSAALDYIQNNVEVSAIVDSQDILNVLATIGLDARIDSIDGGFLAISELVSQLQVNYIDLDSGTTANATAIGGLSASILSTDSNLTVLAQDISDLEATLAGNIQIDSDLIVQAVGGALELLETRIDFNSDEVSILSQSVLDLDADLLLLDSNLQQQISVSAAADQQILAQIIANSDTLSALAGEFTSFEVRFDSAITAGLTITPEEVSAAVGGITDDLYSRITANSDSINLLTSDYTQLNNSLTLLDSAVQANGTAISLLETNILLTDSALEIVSQDLVSLTSTIQGSPWDDAVDSAVAAASSNLVARIDADSDKLEAVSGFTVNLESRLDSDFGHFATATSELQTSVDNLGNATSVYTLNLNANGHVAGIEFGNDGNTADMVIVADKFGIVNASDNAVKPFTINGDTVELSNATVTGALNISSSGNNGSMTMTNDVMQIFDGSSNLRVKFGRLA